MYLFAQLEHLAELEHPAQLDRIAQVEHIVRMHEIQVVLNICNAGQETAGKCNLFSSWTVSLVSICRSLMLFNVSILIHFFAQQMQP
jgi:hypothetical protein